MYYKLKLIDKICHLNLKESETEPTVYLMQEWRTDTVRVTALTIVVGRCAAGGAGKSAE